MMWRIGLLLGAFLCPAAPVRAQTLDPDTVDAWLERVARERGFSGVVLVAQGGQIRLNSGYGRADDAGTPMTSETVVLTGSISKQFTAAAVLLLADDGLLDVNDPISAYLQGVPPDKTPITIHHLLTHTAGFERDHFDDDLTPMNLDEALRAIYALPLGFAPGTDYSYSNTGYTILAAIVQAVSGHPFVAFMRDDVFAQFGLTATGFFGDDWTDRAVATAYFNGESRGPPSTFPGPFWGNMGNAGVMSTTGDLYRWTTALRANQVLTPESTRLLFDPHVTIRPGLHYGYGWFTRDSTELGMQVEHSGLGLGGNSEVAYFPSRDLTIIVLSNRARYRRDGATVVEASLPAQEVLLQLRHNVALGDFSSLPIPTRPRRHHWPVALALLLGAAAIVLIGLRGRRPATPA